MKRDSKSEFLLKITLQTSFVGFLFYAILYSVISVEILYPAIITVAIFLVLDAIIYVLYLKKFFELAKHSILVLLVVTLSILVFFILGPEPGVHYFFLAFTILPLVIITYKKILAWLLYVLINLILFIWAEIFLEDVAQTFNIPENIVIPYKIITISFTVVVISFGLWASYLANRRSEIALSTQAMELEELNKDLQQKNQEIKKNEVKLKEINLLLEDQLKLMEKQQELLKNANATKDKFFSIIAHDLKNPAHNLMGFAQLLAKKFDELDVDKVKAYSKMIYEASESINELIQNLIQWSRTQRGTIKIKPESFSVNELITKNISLQKLAANQKKIKLLKTCPEELSAYADFNMIDTVLRNLLSNAIKFTPKGGSINLSGHEEGNRVILRISDTGRGMDAEEISKLFHIDQTFSKEGTEGEKGTGLGLIIVKEFIEKNEGQISVESKNDHGSTFTISLPLKAKD